MAVDTKCFLDPRLRPLNIFSTDYEELSHQAPMDAKLANDGISIISNFKPALRAARTSPRAKKKIYWGSIRVIKDGSMTVAWELPDWSARYHFFKIYVLLLYVRTQHVGL